MSAARLPVATEARSAPGWPRIVAIVLGLVLALLVVFRGTAASMVAIWWRSQTFSHGFLVVPASALITWRLRGRVRHLVPKPELAPLVAVALFGFGWTIGRVAELQVVEQACFVGMIVAAIWTVLGTPVTRRLAFPLCFLFLAVPAGEFLLAPLMNFTAHFTVLALKLTGVPVARENNFLRVPGAEWKIVEACSGLRYLIASATLGCLYAWWTYTRPRRRLAFLGASIVVPIVANGCRAYLIVMLAYLSDMKMALGIDHYIYGWIFFSLVMGALFWVGARWREAPVETTVAPQGAPGVPRGDRRVAWRVGFAAAGALLLSVLWPAYARTLALPPPTGASALHAPAPRGGWEIAPYPWTGWKPDFQPFDAEVEETYRKGPQIASIYLGYYQDQRQDHEIINMQNHLVSTTDKTWRCLEEDSRQLALPTGRFIVNEAVIRSADLRFVAWSWYWVAGAFTTNPLQAKWLGVRARLAHASDEAALIVVMVPCEGDPAGVTPVLDGFVRDMLPSVSEALRAAGPRAAPAPGPRS